MAKSRFEYVKQFELNDSILPNTWIVVRIDGRGFHKFTDVHKFTKPNDLAALQLMNQCAAAVMEEFQDIVAAFGESDEFSFVFKRATTLYNRRSSKIISSIASCFSSNYVMKWHEFLPDTKLEYAPIFDGRAVAYPSLDNLRDYLSWRQADSHINNLYNTVFWTLVIKGGLGERDAMERLKGSLSADKNEILFTEFGINYSKEPAIFRKGSTLLWGKQEEVTIKVGVTSESDPTPVEREVRRMRKKVMITHQDVIGDEFWRENSVVFDPPTRTKGKPRGRPGAE